MYAVIETGGKQYKVAVGDSLRVEKLDGEEGSEVTLSRVLMVGNGENVQVGKPLLDGAKVTAVVAAQGRGEKIPWGIASPIWLQEQDQSIPLYEKCAAAVGKLNDLRGALPPVSRIIRNTAHKIPTDAPKRPRPTPPARRSPERLGAS